MAKKYLDYDGLLYFWQKIKALFVTDVTYDSTNRKIQKTKNGSTSDVVTLATVATSGSYSDLSNKPTIPSAVQPTTTTPKMDGTAAVGSETKYAKGDHVHPTDTSRVPTTREINGHALNADVILDKTDIGLGGVTDNANVNIGDETSVASGGKYFSIYYGSNQDADSIYNKAAVDGLMNYGNTIIAQNYVPNSAKGTASGVCPLDANSKVDAQYLPSYVDDVIEAYPVSGATALSAGWLSATSGGSALTPETGKIYVLMTDSGDYTANTQFRWGGTTYVKLSDGGVSSITNSEIDTIVAS